MDKLYVIKNNNKGGYWEGKYLIRHDLIQCVGGVEWTTDRKLAATFPERDAVLICGGLKHCTIHQQILMEEL